MIFKNPGIIIIFLFLAVLGLTGLLYYKKKLPSKYVLITLRLLSLCVLLLLILQPVYVVYEKKSRPKLAVLVDTSKSINYAGRLTAFKKFFSANTADINTYFSPEYYQFSNSLTTLKENEIKNLKAEGMATAIIPALEQLSVSKNYDAVLLVSDGNDNSKKTLASIESIIDIPVFACYPLEKTAPLDASVIDIKCSDFVFKNVPLDITVGFYCTGYTGKEAVIYLKKGKEILASRKKYVEGNYQEVSFNFTSSKTGMETYTVEIEPLPGETVLANNTRDFNIETIREKIRVLYISGRPSAEYYYLRHLIKSNPSFELVSFVILRNPEDVAVVPDEQLSLIPFPEREIFTRDLYDYDILIMENFKASKFYIYDEYLNNVKRFVKEKAGAFLMIGGENAFGLGDYRSSVLADILPVQMEGPEELYEQGRFKLKLVNHTHPIVFLSDEQTETEKLWQRLPEVDGCQRLRPKPGALVLAENPYLKINGVSVPVIAVQEVGKGRTMAVGINTSWRWFLGMAKEPRTGSEYAKFWENSLYWLSGSEKTKEFRVSVIQQKYTQNDEVKFKVVALSDKLKKIKPLVTVTDPLSKMIQIENLTAIPEGWLGKFKGVITGKYEIKAQIKEPAAAAGGSKYMQDNRSVVVANESTTEEFDLQVNEKFMNDLAAFTNVDAQYIDNYSAKAMRLKLKNEARPAVKKEVSLSLFPGFYFAIFLLLMLEWIIRRIKGMM